MTALPPIPSDIARAISAYAAAERAFARRCAMGEVSAQHEIDDVVDTAIALDLAIASHLSGVEPIVPVPPAESKVIPLVPRWRDHLPL